MVPYFIPDTFCNYYGYIFLEFEKFLTTKAYQFQLDLTQTYMVEEVRSNGLLYLGLSFFH